MKVYLDYSIPYKHTYSIRIPRLVYLEFTSGSDGALPLGKVGLALYGLHRVGDSPEVRAPPGFETPGPLKKGMRATISIVFESDQNSTIIHQNFFRI